MREERGYLRGPRRTYRPRRVPPPGLPKSRGSTVRMSGQGAKTSTREIVRSRTGTELIVNHRLR